MLSFYRRHRQNCKGNHAHNSRSSEYDERKKGWQRCECPIFVSGTLQGTFIRQNTGQWEWENARSEAIGYEQAKSWSGEPPQIVPANPDGGPHEAPEHRTEARPQTLCEWKQSEECTTM